MKLEINDYELILLNQLMAISVELDKKDELFDKNMDADSMIAAVYGMACLSAKIHDLSVKRLKEVKKEAAADEGSTNKKE